MRATFDFTAENLPIGLVNAPSVRGAELASRHEWSRRANLALARLEKDRSFVGISVGTTDLGFFGSVLERMPTAEGDELILRLRIHMLERDPDYVLNRILYPTAFRYMYSRAAFRAFVLEEYERFAADVMAIAPGSAAHAELALYEPLRPWFPIALYFMNFVETCVSELRFDRALELVEAMAERGLLHHLRDPADLFWKAGRIDDGIEFLEAYEIALRKSGYKPPTGIVPAIGRLKKPGRKPYKPRPRSSTLPAEILLRYGSNDGTSMRSDDWVEPDNDDGRCDHCDREHVRTCRTNDPYTAEISPEDENPDSDWCYRCWSERSQAI